MPVKLSLSSCLQHKGSKTITHMHRETEREREERVGLNPEPNTLHGNVMAFTCSLFSTENEWMADTCWQMINFWCKFPFLRCKKWKVGFSLSSLSQSFRKILLCFWGPLPSVCLHSERSRFSEFSFWGLRSFAVGEREIRIFVSCVLLLFLHSESHFLLQVTNPKHALGFCVFWWWWFCCFQKWENLRCLFPVSRMMMLMMMAMILLKLVKKKNHQMKFFCHEFGFEPFFHTNWIHILQWTSQVIDTGNSSTSSFWVGFVCLFCAGRRRTLAKLSKSSKLGGGGAAATWKLRANGNPTGKDSIGDKATWGKEEEWQDIQSNCRTDRVDQCLCCTAVSQAGTIETRHSQGIQGSSAHPHRWPDRSHARDPPESIWPHHPPRPYHLQACLSLSPILPHAL